MPLTWPKDSGTSTPSSAWPWRSESGEGGNRSTGGFSQEHIGCVNVTYWVRKPSVWYVWPLLVHTHNLLHVLKTGITGDHVVKRRLVVFYNTCEAEIVPSSTRQSFPLTHKGARAVAIPLQFVNSATRGRQDLLTGCINSLVDKEGM